MTHAAAVAFGGAVGAVLRYFAGVAALRLGFVTLPVGTFTVNVVGSLALGFLGRYFAPPNGSPTLFLGLTAGLCGGFTTFSAFSLDLLTMIERGQPGRAILYAIASVTISLAALTVGVLAARNLHPA
jgi:fluoride exporter